MTGNEVEIQDESRLLYFCTLSITEKGVETLVTITAASEFKVLLLVASYQQKGQALVKGQGAHKKMTEELKLTYQGVQNAVERLLEKKLIQVKMGRYITNPDMVRVLGNKY